LASRLLSDYDDVTELLALVSIVSGAAVAVTVPFINARLERSRLEKQGRDARVEELRALLDGAVQHLRKTWTILYEVSEEGQRDLPRPQWSDGRLRQLGDELTTELDSVVEDGLRIKLRTPRTPRSTRPTRRRWSSFSSASSTTESS
jgi:type II secretory pathway pseudopilin PulG